MYSKKPSLIIGFHGCDETVRDKLVCQKTHFQKSEKSHDWLGHGMYFWENDCERALQFANFKKGLSKEHSSNIKNPSVVGAIINLGLCLDFMSSSYLKLLSYGYNILTENIKNTDIQLKNKTSRGGNEFVFRHLDCAVIETLHENGRSNNITPFDSVRGVFWEGEPPYEDAGFREKNHIQICIRNPNCIKGYFIPREHNSEYLIP